MSTGRRKMEPLVEAQYKCGCTWTGGVDSVPDLCRLHHVEAPRAILRGALVGGVNHPDNVHVKHGWVHIFGHGDGNA